jgi:hypothetical protein
MRGFPSVPDMFKKFDAGGLAVAQLEMQVQAFSQ